MPGPPWIRLAILLASLAAFVSGCATAAAQTDAGIAGRAELGPTCPVQRPHTTCTRPYQTTLILYSAPHHRRIRKLRTDRRGRFHIDIGPGRYVITGTRTGPLHGQPTAQDVNATVRPHRVTHVTISFDTGIR
jgi:hypothetical protein